MGLLTDAAAERTIDRDLDQTRLHVHHFLGNAGCPTCKAVEIYHTPVKIFSGGKEVDLSCDLGERVDEGNEPVGPDSFGDEDFPTATAEDRAAIRRAANGKDADEISREQYAKPVSPSILEFRIKELDKDNRRLTIENDAYKLHVKQMEGLLHRLATHIDECSRLIAPVRSQRSDFPKAA